MSSPNHQPLEIWEKVADFLSNDTLSVLLKVNRSLSDVAKARLYRKVKVNGCNQPLKRLLEDIREPGNGQLVLKVSIQPWSESLATIQSSIASRSPVHRVLSHIPSFVRHRYPEALKKHIDDDLQNISSSLTTLPRLMKYKLSWTEDRHVDFRVLYAPLRNAEWCRSLRVLTLRVPLRQLASLVSVQLPLLEELDFRICTLEYSMRDIGIQLDPFLVFVNNLARSLQSLIISTTDTSFHLDLDPLFGRLGSFPGLRQFQLTIPADGHHFSSTGNLRLFLTRHTDLERLSLLTGRATLTPSYNHTHAQQARRWIRSTLLSPSALLDSHFWALHSLQFTVLRDPDALDDILDIVVPVAHQLSSLVLYERPMTMEEVTRIVMTIGGTSLFWKLGLRVERLTPGLLTFVSTRLPDLKILELTPKEVCGDNDGALESLKTQLAQFVTGIRSRPTSRWSLSRLCVAENPYSSALGFQWSDGLERCLTEYIPGVSFEALKIKS